MSSALRASPACASRGADRPIAVMHKSAQRPQPRPPKLPRGPILLFIASPGVDSQAEVLSGFSENGFEIFHRRGLGEVAVEAGGDAAAPVAGLAIAAQGDEKDVLLR